MTSMPTPFRIKQQIDDIALHLVEIGLTDDQQYCFEKRTGKNCIEVTFPKAQHVSIALKEMHYAEIYDHLVRERAYNFKMLDGAIIQMTYAFDGRTLQKHRLAFFPSPYLEEFQNNSDIYLEDEIFADITAQNIVPFPVRFDYDSADDAYLELEHPKSHLTLGQYVNCRIPVSAPLTPLLFVQFLLRNFYHTAYRKYTDKLPASNKFFQETIAIVERQVIHIQVPNR